MDSQLETDVDKRRTSAAVSEVEVGLEGQGGEKLQRRLMEENKNNNNNKEETVSGAFYEGEAKAGGSPTTSPTSTSDINVNVDVLQAENEALAAKLEAARVELERLRHKIDDSKPKTPKVTSFKLDDFGYADIVFVKSVTQKSKAKTIKSLQFTLVVDGLYNLRAFDRSGLLVSNVISLCPPIRKYRATLGENGKLTVDKTSSTSDSGNNESPGWQSAYSSRGEDVSPYPSCVEKFGRLSDVSYEGSDPKFPLITAAFEHGTVSLLSLFARGLYQDGLAGIDLNKNDISKKVNFTSTKWVEYTPQNRTSNAATASSRLYETDLNSGANLHGVNITFNSILSFHAFNSFKNVTKAVQSSSNDTSENTKDQSADTDDDTNPKPAITSSLLFFDVSKARHLIYIGDSRGRVSQFDTSRRMLRQVDLVTREFVHDGGEFESKDRSAKKSTRKVPKRWPLSSKKSGSYINFDEEAEEDDSEGDKSSRYSAVTALARSNNILIAASDNKISLLQMFRLIFIDDVCTFPTFSMPSTSSSSLSDRRFVGYDVSDVHSDLQRPHVFYAFYRPILLLRSAVEESEVKIADTNSNDSNNKEAKCNACRYMLGEAAIAAFNLKPFNDNAMGQQTKSITNCQLASSFLTYNPISLSDVGSATKINYNFSDNIEYDDRDFLSGRIGFGSGPAMRAPRVVHAATPNTLLVNSDNCEINVFNISNPVDVYIEDSINICKQTHPEDQLVHIETAARHRVFIDATPEIRRSFSLSSRDIAAIERNAVFSISVASTPLSEQVNTTLSVAHFSALHYYREPDKGIMESLGRVHYFLIAIFIIFLYNIGKRILFGPERRVGITPQAREQFLMKKYKKNSYDDGEDSNDVVGRNTAGAAAAGGGINSKGSNRK